MESDFNSAINFSSLNLHTKWQKRIYMLHMSQHNNNLIKNLWREKAISENVHENNFSHDLKDLRPNAMRSPWWQLTTHIVSPLTHCILLFPSISFFQEWNEIKFMYSLLRRHEHSAVYTLTQFSVDMSC